MTSRRAVRRRRSIRAGVIAAAVLVVSGSTFAVAPSALAQPLSSNSVTVTVLDVQPSTPPDTTATTPLTVTLQLTNNTDETMPSVHIEGARGDPITSRTELDAAIDKPQMPDPNLVGDFNAQKPVITTLDARSTTDVSYTVLSTTDDSSVQAGTSGLCICQNRIYPLYFALHLTDVTGADVLVGTGQTYVPAFGDQTKPPTLGVSWVWPLIDRPHRLVGDTTFTDDDLASSVSIGRLERVLEVVEGVATHGVAMTLVIDPELLDELAVMAAGPYTVTVNGKNTQGSGTQAARSWLMRLRATLVEDPALQVDLTALADPDVESLTRNGLTWTTGLSQAVQARVTSALGGHAAATDLAWPADGAVSSDTLTTLARDGATSVIVSDHTLPESGGVTNTTNATVQLGTVQTSAGQLTADVTQLRIQNLLTPVLTLGGQGTMLLPQLISQVAVSAIASQQEPGFVTIVAPRDIDPAPTVAIRAILDTADTFWSTSLTLAQAAHSVAPSNRGALVPPASDAPQLSALTISSARTVSMTVPALATMMSTVDASAKLGALPTAIQRAESTWWRTDATDGDAFVNQLSKVLTGIESGVRIVQPSTGTYTLASANSPLPVTVENNLDVTVTVRVQVSSYNGVPGFTAKELGNQTIAPNTKVILHVPTHVERTGRFKVQAILLTPSGVAIGPSVIVSVRSTALGFIGVVITIAAAVVLVAALLVRFVRRWMGRSTSRENARAAAQ